MDQKSQVFNIIRDNLFRSFIFYVPKQFYHYIEPTFIANIITPGMVNIIAYSNLERKITTVPSEMNGLELLGKDSLLNQSIDLLLSQKEILSETAFNHLYQQYLEHAGMYWMFSVWLSKNVRIDLPDTPSSIISMFELQANTFDKHADKLDSYFGEKEQNNNYDASHFVDLVSDSVEDITVKEIEKPSPVPELKTNIEEKEIIAPTVETKKEKAKEEKEPLMTDEKARNFLLESVFGIEAKYLDS